MSNYNQKKIVKLPYGNIVKYPYSKIANFFSNKFIPSQPHSKTMKLVQSHTGELSTLSQMIFTGIFYHI